MMYYRRQIFLSRSKIIGLLLIFLFITALIFKLLFSAERGAENAIHKFYEYEMAGEFSASWEMFHPYMQEKFTKAHYIQDRAHVFLNHFNVETFDVQYGKAKKINEWSFAKNKKTFKDVYKMKIIQTFKGKYGKFEIYQDVYAVKVKGEWKILWDYNK